MFETLEQEEDFLPPPIDDWDDDLLPPSYISDDDTSVDIKDFVPYVSEPADSKPAAIPKEESAFARPPKDCPLPAPELEDKMPAANLEPPSILDKDTDMPPAINITFVSEAATTTPIAPSILDDDAFIPEIVPTVSPCHSKPATVLDNDVAMPSAIHAPFDSETLSTKPTAVLDNNYNPPTAMTWSCDVAAFPDVLQPPSTENAHNNITQHTSFSQTEEIWHPEPSAPFEPTDEIDESESDLASILNAMDPSERSSFFEEQNKILENIQRESIEKDAALAKKLQEEEGKHLQQRLLHNRRSETRSGKHKIRVECLSCHNKRYVPHFTEVMYCEVCADVCAFQISTSKKGSGGFFGRIGRSNMQKHEKALKRQQRANAMVYHT